MTSEKEPADPLLELAGAIADGRVIDWGSATESTSAKDRILVDNLRKLAQVAAAHRQPAMTTPSADGKDQPHPEAERAVMATFHRGHLETLDKTGSMLGGRILHYQILERLGQGGMGVVYKARDEKLGRLVALKFLPPGMLESTAERSRLMREARAAASLDHPGICTVHDVEESDGQIFIAMAYVEGESLKEKISSGPPPMELEEALDLVSQVADAMGSAHSRGVVHRDVKPANIMVSAEGRAKVLDFGLAKLLDGVKLTQTGEMMGTVAYMSPEQARGEAVDHRTDIWSLGVVLYELVCGARPFRGEYSAALLHSILNEEPVPVTSWRAGLPVELDRVLAKALAKDPGDRYQTAGEFREELERLRVGSPVSAPAVRRRRKAGQQLLAALGALVTVLAVVIGLDVGGLRGRLTGGGPGRITSLAVLPVTNLSGDPEQEYFADGMTDALIANLASIGGFERVIARQSVMRFKGTQEPLKEIARQLKVEALVEASVLRAGDEVQVTARLIEARTDRHLWSATYKGDMSDMLTLLSEVTASIADGIDVALTPAEEARLAETRPVDPEVYQLYLQGRYYMAKDMPDATWKSIECFEKALERDPSYAPAYAQLADSYMDLGSTGISTLTPPQAYGKARTAAMRALELDDNLAEAHFCLGRLFKEHDWDWAGAERELKRAIELNPNYALPYSFYGTLLLFLGRPQENIAMARRARELDPLSPYLNASVAFMYCWAGEYQRAMQEARATLEMYPDYWVTHWAVSWIYLSEGKYTEAITKLQQTLELSGQNIDVLATLGNAYGAAGRRDEALEVLARLRERGPEQGYTPPAAVAQVYAGLGEKDEAFVWLEKAYEERSPWIPWISTQAFANLHSDPRYDDLLRRAGLPARKTTGATDSGMH